MKSGSIKTKVFISLLSITLLVVVAMALMMRLGVDRGFDRYKKSQEHRFNQKILKLLSQHYENQGGWEVLRTEPIIWKELIYHAAFKITDQPSPLRQDDTYALKRKPLTQGQQKKRQAKFTMKRMLPNYSVYDLDKKKVVGSIDWDRQNHQIMIIKAGGQKVGYLITLIDKGVRMEEERQFNQGIQRLLMTMAVLMALFSLLLTIPIARYFTQPIQKLTRATKKATAGDFSVRTDITRQDELGQLSNNFNHLIKTLESNATTQKNMMADIAHELRTPLAVTLAQIEAIQDGIHQADEKTLGILHQQITALNRLVNDLYELSLSDLGTMRYEMKTIDLLDVLKQSFNAFKLAFEQKQIACQLEFHDQPHQILGDDKRLCQLFYNLFNNAVQYTSQGGQVRVLLNQSSENYLIVIEDSEPGLPPEAMAKMFNRMYCQESSRNKASGGSGLGLAIAKNIVKAHNGTIEASPSELGGIKMTIKLAKT